jgi:SecD/SecF fusion protein
MKDSNLTFRSLMILLVLGLCVYSIIPSWQVHSQSEETREDFIRQNPKVANKAINFGLDLAGGSHVVVEMDTSVVKPEAREKSLSLALEILRNRVDKRGVSEPQIYKSGEARIVADLAGVNAESARELIGSTAKLEFKLVLGSERLVPIMNRIDDYLKTNKDKSKAIDSSTPAEAPKEVGLLGETDYDALAGVAADSTADSAKVAEADSTKFEDDLDAFKARPFSGLFTQFGNDLAVPEANVTKVQKILEDSKIQNMIPYDIQLALGRGYQTTTTSDKVKLFYILKRRAEMGGEDIREATAQHFNGLEVGVSLVFGGIGPKKFGQITGNNIGNQLAIVLDDQVVSAPVIRGKIPNGVAQITGLDDFAEATQLSVVLGAGALPAPMKIIELRSVGASLGAENISSGIKASLIGLALVVAFMIIYYMGAGLYSVVALVFNLVIILAIMSGFNATLTLPGIAGIILTIGMAVDANVIIFERIREEIRAGRSGRAAVATGFDKAFSTIIDANITTFLTAFILFKIGSGPVKGFGLTLMVGIAATLFTALYVTRYFFMLSEGKKVSIGKGFDVINNPKLQFMRKSKGVIMASVILIIASIGSMATIGLNYSVDFTGGHLITLDVEKPVSTTDMEAMLQKSESFSKVTVRTISSPEGNHFLAALDYEDGQKSLAKEISTALSSLGKVDVLNEDLVGPTIGDELRLDAVKAILLALLIIILYIWFRFGSRGFSFGLAAVITLGHDVILTLGIFSVLGMEIDAAFIAAILTIVGYSLNDTIVVFDRIRENAETGSGDFTDIVDNSISQSVSRTLITSVTTFFVTIIIALFGGIAIREFAWAMTIGVVIGTYSSIFVASPFVVWWAKRNGVKS